MASLFALPVELLQSILIPLIVPDIAMARNVCRSWRKLCDSPNAVPSARRKLVEIRGISRTNRTTAIVANKLRSFVQDEFNREEYLLEIGFDVAEEFKIWALETP